MFNGVVNYTHSVVLAVSRRHILYIHTHLKADVSERAGPCLCDVLDSGTG